MEKFTGKLRRCAEDYAMIGEGDVVAVGVSGGKDSLALLSGLAELRSYYPRRFSLRAVTLDMGFGTDFSGVGETCGRLGVPWTLEKTEIASVLFEHRAAKRPCSLCARMRRAALCDLARKAGAGKLALGHHFDDAVETFLMSLIYEGRLHCFDPVTEYGDVTVIRPMLYVGEGTVRRVAEELALPVVKNPCPMDGQSRRQEMKALAAELSRRYPGFRDRVLGAMQRLPLYGWGIPREDGPEDVFAGETGETGKETTPHTGENTEK